MNLKVGDFLIRVEGDLTSIAVVKAYYQKDDWYTFQSIHSVGGTHEFDIKSYEIEWYGWKPLDAAMLRSQY